MQDLRVHSRNPITPTTFLSHFRSAANERYIMYARVDRNFLLAPLWHRKMIHSGCQCGARKYFKNFLLFRTLINQVFFVVENAYIFLSTLHQKCCDNHRHYRDQEIHEGHFVCMLNIKLQLANLSYTIAKNNATVLL